MKAKLTYQNKLSWLKAKGYITKAKRPSTINRLYSAFTKNPDIPFDVAYGNRKRLQRKIETGTNIATPKGDISGKDYIRNFDKTTKQKIRDELPPNITNIHFNKYYSGVKKLRDYFRWNINPNDDPQKSGLFVTNTNKFNILKHLHRKTIPGLMKDINFIWKGRQLLYRGYEIGAVIGYTVEGSPTPGDPRGVGFTSYSEFPKYLHDMLWELIVNDILRNYPEAVINLTHFEIILSTPQTMNKTDAYRYHR